MRRSTLVIVLLSVIAVCFATAMVGGAAVSVPRWPVGARPDGLPFEEIAVPSEPGIVIRGWAIPNDCACGVIVLLHGSGASRDSMLPRARFLHRAGYSVIVVDMRAHGLSDGSATTFGGRESRDVRAVIAEARRRFAGQKLGAIGFSLGGAALLLGDTPADVDALVVEEVYSTIDDTARRRIATTMGPVIASVLPWLLYAQMPWRFGVSRDELRPVDRIGAVAVPILVIGGDKDPFVPADETRRLFQAAREPKALWIVPGAAHQDLHQAAPVAYEQRVLDFFRHGLRSSGG